ncbi:hypothetical protein CMV_027576, partial [Castanea mollissima]
GREHTSFSDVAIIWHQLWNFINMEPLE